MNSYRKMKDKIIELQNYVCENSRLTVAIQSSKYPLSIEFSENQIDMFSIVTTESFKINETVFTKLKNLSKEINRLYLHAYREEIEKVIEPIWDTTDGRQVAVYNKRLFDKLMNQ